MRVLLVSQEFPPETGWGGIGTYVGIIAPALARAGAEVHVLSVVRGQERCDSEVEGVHVHRTPLRRPPAVGRALRLPLTWSRLSLAGAVAVEYRRLGIDFDVCESPEWGAEGLVLSFKSGLPLVTRLHSGASQIFPYLGEVDRDRRLAIRCEEALIKRADLVTGTSAQTSTVPPALGVPPGRVRQITYPVRPVETTPLPTGPPRVLFAGRFEARKGADVLLRAVPRLLESVPDARITLLGTDTGVPGPRAYSSYSAGLRRLVDELGIGHAAEIVDEWGRDAVARELARAAVVVVPSRWESFGYVAAEAAAAGRPVVASRIPALEPVIVDGVTGRLVPPGDAAALAGALGGSARQCGSDPARWVPPRRSDPDPVRSRPRRGQTLAGYEDAIARAGRPVRGGGCKVPPT